MRFEFVGRVVEWRGPAPYFYVAVPAQASADIREVSAAFTYGWGAIPVEARVGETTFTTSLFPKDGRYLLPLKDAVRKPLQVEVDEDVTVSMILRPPGGKVHPCVT